MLVIDRTECSVVGQAGCDHQQMSKEDAHAQLRATQLVAERMSAAKLKGSHTPQESVPRQCMGFQAVRMTGPILRQMFLYQC